VLGITRFGLAKMKESVLMLASVSALVTGLYYSHTVKIVFLTLVLQNIFVYDECA